LGDLLWDTDKPRVKWGIARELPPNNRPVLGTARQAETFRLMKERACVS
jgi:hypothetical protein